jgi:hypothetical protein
VTTLPKLGPVETYAQYRAALPKAEFLQALDGVGAFVRLDERGGDDEPAPWAFHGSGLPLPVDIPSSEEDVFLDRTRDTVLPVSVDESTATGPTMQLSIPPARGRATLIVIPKKREVLMGREKRNDICVPERSVSKMHAKLLVEEARFTVYDLGSHNGMSVNGQKVKQQARLTSGDIVELGDVSLLFLDASELWDGLPRLQGG